MGDRTIRYMPDSNRQMVALARSGGALENEAENRLLNVGTQRTISIQLKMAIRSRGLRVQLGEWLRRSSENYLITLEDRPSSELKEYSDQGRYLTRDWIKSAVAHVPAVDQWLSRSLNWLMPQGLK